MSSEALFHPGERVLLRGESWTIVERSAFADCVSLRLAGAGKGNAGAIRTFLAPFDRPRRVDRPTTLGVVRPRRWLHGVQRLAADARPFGGLAAAAVSGIQLMPYQLEPALAMLRLGATRVMIADAVGLGKTIQAGLLLSELASGHEAFRAIVIVPAGLREQWTRELTDHFHLSPVVAGAAWLVRIGRELPPEVNPWRLPGIYISSFDFLKRPEVLRPLEEMTWDAAVVDEAHGVTLGSARRAAVHAIALRSRRVLLLTATPHGGDALQFAALCRIGEAGPRDGPLLVFRRSCTDAGEHRRRRSVMLRVRATGSERRMHRLLDRYATRVCREARARDDARARLAVIILRKRALSSAASLAASARTRLALLADEWTEPEHQLALPLGDDDSIEDDEPDRGLGAPGLADASRERRWLAAIVDAALEASRVESKVAFLLRLLARIREPAIIFTEYRDTLMRLERAIGAAGHRIVVLHGGLGPLERDEARRAFNAGETLLLATDAASEGLNLHRRCRTVVHFELPWSPARLEQRTGRVDRIGQTRTVHEILLVADDTAERFVLAPLARRAARARAALGGGSRLLDLLTESQVASAVMDGQPLPDASTSRQGAAPDVGPGAAQDFTTTEPCTASPPGDLPAEARAEAGRLREQRVWHSRSRHRPHPASILVTALRRGPRALGPGIVAVYRLSITGADGSLVHTETVAAHEPWIVRASLHARRDARGLAKEFVASREATVRAAIVAGHAGRLAAIERARGRCDAAIDRRERAIAAALPTAARDLVQAGLFDRRAVGARAALRSTGKALLDEADARIEARSAARGLTVSLQLFALLIVPGAGSVR